MSEFHDFVMGRGFTHRSWFDGTGGSPSTRNHYCCSLEHLLDEVPDVGLQLEVSTRTQLTYEPELCELALRFLLPDAFEGQVAITLYDPQRLPELFDGAVARLLAGYEAMRGGVPP